MNAQSQIVLLARLCVLAAVPFMSACGTAKETPKTDANKAETGTAGSGQAAAPGAADGAKETPAAPQAKAPELTVGAAEIAADYKDEAAGDKKYKNKTVAVKGAIDDPMFLDTAGRPCITLGKDGAVQVQCFLQAGEVKKQAALWKGQELTLVGQFFGKGAWPAIMECQITEVGTAPKVEKVDLKALLGEFAANLDDAKKKYQDKSIEFTGVVDAIEKGDQVFYVRSDAAEPPKVRIRVAWAYDSRKEVADLKVGDKVTIKAVCDGTDLNGKNVTLSYWRILR